MIRKNIVSILIILILLNSVGCYSLKDVNIDDIETIKKYERVKLTTLDDKVYSLIHVEVKETEIVGIDSKNTQKGIIKFRKEDIKNFEIKKIDGGLTLFALVGIVGGILGVMIVFQFLLPKKVTP